MPFNSSRTSRDNTMSSIDVNIKFESVSSAAEFRALLEQHENRYSGFGVALNEEKLHVSNEVLTILLTFMDHGGLPAVTAFLQLVREIIKRIPTSRSVLVTRGPKTVQISDESTDKEIEKASHELLP
jgi:hypothetical protein